MGVINLTGFIAWVSLRAPLDDAPRSALCLSPGSHALPDQPAGPQQDVLPPTIRAQLEAGEAQWDVLDSASGLAGTIRRYAIPTLGIILQLNDREFQG
jgi:hypothetical protein